MLVDHCRRLLLVGTGPALQVSLPIMLDNIVEEIRTILAKLHCLPFGKEMMFRFEH